MANNEMIFDARLNTSGFSKDAGKLGDIVKGLGVFEVIKKGLAMVTSSIDAAVSRYDTLNRFPKIMQQMGYSSEQAGAATQKLSDGIQGLPTTLDGIVSNTKQLVIATGSLDTGVDSALALNNAFLASGATSEEAARGMIQYIQMLSSGKVDMQSWRTLNETMTYALQKTAESFGFAGTSAKTDLYAALRDGVITFEDFNARIIQLNNGVGGFAEMAKTATGGIGTAMTNLKTRTVMGVTAIIEALDRGLSKTRFKSIENIINTASNGIKSALMGVATVVEFVITHLDLLGPAAIGVATAFAAHKAITSWNTTAEAAAKTAKSLARINGELTLSITKTTGTKLQAAAATAKETAATTAATAKKAAAVAAEKALAAEQAKASIIKGTSIKAINSQNDAELARIVSIKASKVASESQTAAEVAQTAAKKANSAAQREQSLSVGLGTALIGYLTGAYTLNTVATAAATAATTIFKMALNALPLIGIVAAIGAVVAGLIALVSWLARGSKEYQQQKQEVEALTEKQEALNTSVTDSAKAHEDNITAINGATQEGQNYLAVLKGMVDENGKLTASHDQAAVAIDDLNAAYEGLNLSYDEETGHLSASVEEIENYINAKNSLSKTAALDERRVQLAGEQAQIEANLAEIAAKRQVIENNANLSEREKRKLIEELDAATEDYNATMETLAMDIEANNLAIEASTDSMAQNTINQYEAINGARTEDGLNLKQLAKQYDTSTAQILADMEAQGLTMQQWADNNAALYTEDGLNIDQLAAKWGMTTEEVTAYMDEWGMGLDEFSQEMDATHTSAGLNLEQLAAKWGLSTEDIKRQMAMQGVSMQEWSDNIDGKCDEVINSFEEIPGKYEKSADEMIAVLKTNAERYSTWTANIATLSQTMSAEAIAELQKLGPEANSAIEEMIADPSKAAEFEESILAVMQAGAGGAEAGATDPRFLEAGSQVGQGIGEGVAASTEAEEAATQMITDVATAADTAVAGGNFQTIGQKIATEIVNGVKNSDMSGISTALTSSVQAGASSVNGALSTMSSQMSGQFTTMRTTAVNTITQMMTSVVSGISTRAGAARSAATSVSTGVTTSYTDMRTKAVNIVQQMMTSFVSGITTRAGSAKSAARGVSTGVITEFESMKTKAKTVVEQMMTSVVAAIKNGTEAAKSAASGVVDAIIAAINAKGTDAHNAGKNIGSQMANGMVAGLDAGKGSVYAKADEIAREAARRIRAALEVHSPSRVMEDIFGNVVLGMISGMEDEEGALFRVIDNMAAAVIARIGVIPESMATALNQRLRLAISTNQLAFAGLPAVAAAGAAPNGPVTNIYFYQTINSPKHTSPSENSREAEAMLRRAKWQIK